MTTTKQREDFYNLRGQKITGLENIISSLENAIENKVEYLVLVETTAGNTKILNYRALPSGTRGKAGVDKEVDAKVVLAELKKRLADKPGSKPKVSLEEFRDHLSSALTHSNMLALYEEGIKLVVKVGKAKDDQVARTELMKHFQQNGHHDAALDGRLIDKVVSKNSREGERPKGAALGPAKRQALRDLADPREITDSDLLSWGYSPVKVRAVVGKYEIIDKEIADKKTGGTKINYVLHEIGKPPKTKIPANPRGPRPKTEAEKLAAKEARKRKAEEKARVESRESAEETLREKTRKLQEELAEVGKLTVEKIIVKRRESAAKAKETATTRLEEKFEKMVEKEKKKKSQ